MRKVRIVFLNRKTLLIAFGIFMLIALAVTFTSDYPGKSPAAFIDPGSRIIVVDPGHGGIDGGASWKGLLEKDINLDISKRLKNLLELRGYTVVMTREEDVSLEGLSNIGGSRHLRDLNARVEIINNSNAQFFLSIHVNCHLRNARADGSIVYYKDNYAQNKILAYSIQRALNNMVIDGKKRTVRDPRIGNYYLLNHAQIPGVIVEMAFISNPVERELLTRDSFRDDIAEAVARGVDNYLHEKDSVLKTGN